MCCESGGETCLTTTIFPPIVFTPYHCIAGAKPEKAKKKNKYSRMSALCFHGTLENFETHWTDEFWHVAVPVRGGFLVLCCAKPSEHRHFFSSPSQSPPPTVPRTTSPPPASFLRRRAGLLLTRQHVTTTTREKSAHFVYSSRVSVVKSRVCSPMSKAGEEIS